MFKSLLKKERQEQIIEILAYLDLHKTEVKGNVRIKTQSFNKLRTENSPNWRIRLKTVSSHSGVIKEWSWVAHVPPQNMMGYDSSQRCFIVHIVSYWPLSTNFYLFIYFQ